MEGGGEDKKKALVVLLVQDIRHSQHESLGTHCISTYAKHSYNVARLQINFVVKTIISAPIKWRGSTKYTYSLQLYAIYSIIV